MTKTAIKMDVHGRAFSVVGAAVSTFMKSFSLKSMFKERGPKYRIKIVNKGGNGVSRMLQ